MPAERSSRLVFRDESMCEQSRGNTRPCRDPLSQREKKWWNRTGRQKLIARKIIGSTVTYDPAASRELLVFRFHQRELADLSEQLGFLLRRNEVSPADKTRWQCSRE